MEPGGAGGAEPLVADPFRFALPDWPVFGLADDVRPALAEALERGVACALVTLVQARGGAPRPEGAQMLATADGQMSGFLSGGCVEGDVLIHAAETLGDGRPRTLIYGEGSPWPDIRLLCGARIELLVERLSPDDAAALRLCTLAAARRPASWFTDGVRRACIAAGEPEPLAEGFAIRRRYEPAPRLVVIGSDPTALAIATAGAPLGYETHLIRPRGPEAPPPVAGVAYHRGALEEGLAAAGLDAWTYVAVATHDMALDEAALALALPSQAAYVGVLGARRRLQERKGRLRGAGVGDEALARVHAPIGLDLGGKAPFEIAVSVMAEITAARHRGAPALLERLAAVRESDAA